MKKLNLLLILLFAASFVLAQNKQVKTDTKTAVANVKSSAAKSVDVTQGTIKTNSTATVVSYDFTVAGAAYVNPNVPGNPPMVVVDNINGQDVYAMIAGDANSSGIVTYADKDPINTEVNLSGYYKSDLNLSGIVTYADKDYVNSNVNKSTHVPQ